MLGGLWYNVHLVGDRGGGLVGGCRMDDILVDGGFPSSMSLSACVLVLVARVDEALMADEEIAASEGLCTDVANEWLFFGMGSNMSLKVFLRRRKSVLGGRRGVGARKGSHQARKEALTVRAW